MNLILKNLFFSFILLNGLFANFAHARESKLYPDEEIRYINGCPALIGLIKNNIKKNPLIVFIPGDANLGRIAYGYPDSNKKDFLAYWFHQQGYSFLSISYPTDNPIFTKICPAFTIRDWGQQAMEIASQIIKENKLSEHIIVLGWSMGGIISESVSEAAENKNLKLDFFVALAATPPLPNLIVEQAKTIVKKDNGLADRISLRRDRFYRFLLDQDSLNNYTIIPKDIYIHQFLGDPPVALLNTPYRYHNQAYIFSELESLHDSGAYQYANYPLVAVIHGDSLHDPQHAIVDSNTWMMINQQRIFHKFIHPHIKQNAILNMQEWRLIREISVKISKSLVAEIPGNHFFFVGQLGAQKTVDAVIQFRKSADEINHALDKLFS